MFPERNFQIIKMFPERNFQMVKMFHKRNFCPTFLPKTFNSNP